MRDESWYFRAVIPEVSRRDTAIIEARGASSDASAANLAVDHFKRRQWASLAVVSERLYDGWVLDLRAHSVRDEVEVFMG